MPMSTTDSGATHSWAYPSEDASALSRSERRLPPLLSVIAGMVDVIGYLSLGKLFTAHVTGNLVVIAALLVRGGPPKMAEILAVPVFIVAVAAVWLIAKASERRGPLKRRIGGGGKGFVTDDLVAAVREEFKENEDLPNTSHPDDWAKIAGRKGERIVAVKSLVGHTRHPQQNVEKVITTGQYL